MSTAIAVLVKTPGLSPIKTRLAAKLGVTQAEIFYKLAVLAITELIQDCISNAVTEQLSAYWAVAEQDGLQHHLWQSYPRIHTVGSSFGEILHNLYSYLQLKNDKVLLIGVDSPQLSAELILRTIAAMDHTTGFHLGPTIDGGFYLFAGSQAIPKKIWTNVSYSTTSTSKQLCAQLQSIAQIHSLEQLVDVDCHSDLTILAQELARQTLSPAQQRINDWLTAYTDCSAMSSRIR